MLSKADDSAPKPPIATSRRSFGLSSGRYVENARWWRELAAKTERRPKRSSGIPLRNMGGADEPQASLASATLSSPKPLEQLLVCSWKHSRSLASKIAQSWRETEARLRSRRRTQLRRRAVHSITSSARASRVGGTVRPRAFYSL